MFPQWGPGYTQAQLEDAQARWSFRFPPDVLELYLQRRPIFLHEPRPNQIMNWSSTNIDWVETDPEIIRERLEWPFDGFLFDVEQNGLWWREWGPKPVKPDDLRERLREVFASAPKLIPIYGHRYIPDAPHESGNPVFSVYQSDVIYYGADLLDYFERECLGTSARPWPESIKTIPFWTLAVDRNG